MLISESVQIYSSDHSHRMYQPSVWNLGAETNGSLRVGYVRAVSGPAEATTMIHYKE